MSTMTTTSTTTTTRRPRASSPAHARVHTRAQAQGTAAPVPTSALALLARSDAELVAAQLAGAPEDRFLHAHLAALRAGAALLEVTGRPVRRPAPRTVWEMVAIVAPALAEWTAFFAAGASSRSALEAGRDGGVDDARAERTVCAAEDFLDAVRARVVPEGAAAQRPLTLRAS